MLPFVLAYFMNGDDVGVLEIGGSFGFCLKTLYKLGAGEFARQQQLYGKNTPEADLPGFPHYTHPPSRHFL
jgi:hypothetical protein